ncbi:unnamed protein product, partial [Ectocarpus sp. 12 AP-2014]
CTVFPRVPSRSHLSLLPLPLLLAACLSAYAESQLALCRDQIVEHHSAARSPPDRAVAATKRETTYHGCLNNLTVIEPREQQPRKESLTAKPEQNAEELLGMRTEKEELRWSTAVRALCGIRQSLHVHRKAAAWPPTMQAAGSAPVALSRRCEREGGLASPYNWCTCVT